MTLFEGFAIGLAGVGLGGLAGLGFKDDGWRAGLLASGVALEAGAIALAALSLASKSHAHGHALDAVNHYNDAVGFVGESCTAPK